MLSRLAGKVALITGGASGIGEVTSRLFVRQGAKVVIADVQDDLGRSVCGSITAASASLDGSDVSYVHCDVAVDGDVRRAFDYAVERHGKLDIAFVNAGIFGNPEPRIVETDDEDFQRVMEVNVFGSYLCAKHAARVMIPEKKGSIVFCSSLAGVIAPTMVKHAYVTSKHAVVGLMKNLCVELGQHGIRVNAVAPFMVMTPMVKNGMGLEGEGAKKKLMEASNLKGVFQEADDIAEAVLYLSSNESKYVSGLNLVVDGGYHHTNPTVANALLKLLPQS